MTELKQMINEHVTNQLKTYQALALDIHQNPEVSNYEFHSAEVLANQLREEGFDVKLDVAGHRTGFDARYNGNKKGPVIVFLAEYDALPGIGHACGHNLFGTTSSLAGAALKKVIDEVGGEIRVYGTPGEEGGENGSAKGSFVRHGFFDDVDVALCVHPGSKYGKTSPSLANNPVDIEFFGQPSHASAAPEKGINALDAVIQVYNSINALRQHLTDDVRIHGIITNGGEIPNVVPEYASARFYLRAASRPTLDELHAKVGRIVDGAALATGATGKFGLFQNAVDNTVLTPTFDAIYLAELANLEISPSEIATAVPTSLGSSDVGNVSQVVPTIQPTISISDEELIPHSVAFREAAKSPKGLASIGIGAQLLANTALELLLNHELLNEIKREHQQNVDDQTN